LASHKKNKKLNDLKKIGKVILRAKKIAIFTHSRPDGDALGCSYGLMLALKSKGINAKVFLEEKCNSKEYLLIEKENKTKKENMFEFEDFNCKDADLKIALDCADIKRLGKIEEFFFGKTVVLDHHAFHNKFSDIFFVDYNASSTGEIIYILLKIMKIPITKAIANNLYISIISDSGCFKYSCTRSLTHKIASKLIETGIDFTNICKKMFDTLTPEYLKIMKIVIERMEFYANGKISFIYLDEKDFLECKFDEKSNDDLVYLARNIENVEIGVYVRKRQECFKVSLRSNSYANVTNIARKFGGGGHIKAAGFSTNGSLKEIKEKIIDLASKEINEN
jgi:phosphoesterase RecJ-like protein